MIVHFEDLENFKLVQLRVLPAVGCEKFAEFVYNLINYYLFNDDTTCGRVHVKSVECIENKKNSAIFIDHEIENDIRNNNTMLREIKNVQNFQKYLSSQNYLL